MVSIKSRFSLQRDKYLLLTVFGVGVLGAVLIACTASDSGIPAPGPTTEIKVPASAGAPVILSTVPAATPSPVRPMRTITPTARALRSIPEPPPPPPVTDREALVAIYHAIYGPLSVDSRNWLTNWLTDEPLGTWRGVTTDDNGRVTELQLDVGHPIVAIPPELGSLIKLTVLDLSKHYGIEDTDVTATRSIPRELGNLSNLVTLRLSGLQLTGSIPLELVNLNNLELLVLKHNNLTGEVPRELSKLANLQVLHLADNGLVGEIPPELGKLSNLQDLYLWGNQFTGKIPQELGSLSELTKLHLYNNKLSGNVPLEIGNLSNLQSLRLSNNRLTGEFPQSFAELRHLRSIEFSNNAGLCMQLTLKHLYEGTAEIIEEGSLCEALPTPIPPSLTRATPLPPEETSVATDRAALVALYNVTGGPQWQWGNSRYWLTDLPLKYWYGVATNEEGRVTELNLGDNYLTGPIPPEVGNLSKLTRLDLKSDQDIGIGSLSLHLGDSYRSQRKGYDNYLTGPIPPELGNLSNLTYLNLYGNYLTGRIPPELGNLSNLEVLDLRWNNLSGHIPLQLGNLHNLKYLDLWDNDLAGTIPPELGNLTNLTYLNLWDNGPIPPELGNLTNLTELRIGSNNLTGSIPPELGNLSELIIFYFGRSQLTGELPRSLTKLTKLENIGFYENAGLCAPLDTMQDWLQGIKYPRGPTCPLPVPKLHLPPHNVVLNLEGNDLTRAILFEQGMLDKDTYVALKEDNVDDLTILELTNLTELLYLGLSGKGLEGPIPPWLGTLTNLYELDLSNNNLTGPIPPELGNLTNLTSLDLSNNDFTGPIPPELGNLTNLSHIHLNDNRLTGQVPYSFLALTVIANEGTTEFNFERNAGLCIPVNLRKALFIGRGHREC